MIFWRRPEKHAALYQSANLRALPCKTLQLDEIWSFVGCKERQKKSAINQHPGDVWTWTSICAETKLIPAWRVGDRSSRTGYDFCRDLSTRFSGTVQITSDGHPAYKMAIGSTFDLDRTHFAQLIKIYGQDDEGKDVVIRTERQPVFGTPDIDLVSTSYVERSNLTIRMGNRRFTRLTNAFSKKLENHCHMLAVTFMHYNFCRKHTTLKETPAQAANVAGHQWTLEEVVEMIDAHFVAKIDAEFEMAFAAKLTPQRTTPKLSLRPRRIKSRCRGISIRTGNRQMKNHKASDPLPINWCWCALSMAAMDTPCAGYGQEPRGGFFSIFFHFSSSPLNRRAMT